MALTSQGPGQFSTAIANKPIVGPGIPPGTTIAAASAGTLTLSKNATVSGSGVTLNAGDERELPNIAGTGGTATGTLSTGSPTVTSLASATGEGYVTGRFVNTLTTTSGAFRIGQTIRGAGVPTGTTITRWTPAV